MKTGSRAVVASLMALTLSAPMIGVTSAASAATWSRYHHAYSRYHYRHYGWRHYRRYGWHRHYYRYGGAPVLGAVIGGLGGLAAGLAAGPYYYGPPYAYYYGPGPYPYWW
jgi:hypothetical protein